MSGNHASRYPPPQPPPPGPPYYPASPAHYGGPPHVIPASAAHHSGHHSYRPGSPAYYGSPDCIPASAANYSGGYYGEFPATPAHHSSGPSCIPAAPATYVGGSMYPSAPPMGYEDVQYPATAARNAGYTVNQQFIEEQRGDNYGWIPPSHCVGTHNWVPSSAGHVPPDAVHGGMDKDGGPIFIGRAYHDGDLLPAKVCPRHGCAFVCFSGTEITKMHYEVLCSNHVAWKFARNGEYPPEAIRVGTTSGGEPLFVGRTMIEGTMTPGKVHPSHGCLYIPFDGKEISVPEYEILILN